MSDAATDAILAELEAIRREQAGLRQEVAGLRSELLRRKAAGTKRARTRAKVVAKRALEHGVNELDIQRAMKRIARAR